jgi:transcriptional regulator with XRE-family HTH domain
MRQPKRNIALINAVAEKGMTFSQLADEVGIHKGSLSRILNKQSNPHRTTVKAIAAVLDKTPEELCLIPTYSTKKHTFCGVRMRMKTRAKLSAWVKLLSKSVSDLEHSGEYPVWWDGFADSLLRSHSAVPEDNPYNSKHESVMFEDYMAGSKAGRSLRDAILDEMSRGM